MFTYDKSNLTLGFATSTNCKNISRLIYLRQLPIVICTLFSSLRLVGRFVNEVIRLETVSFVKV